MATHLLKIKVTDDCPNRGAVLEYYNSLQRKGDNTTYKGDSGIDLIFTHDETCRVDRVTKIKLGIQCEMVVQNRKEIIYKFICDVTGNVTNRVGTRYGEDHDSPEGYTLVPRSSISSTPLMMANNIGIIDAGYRGEIIAPVRCFVNADDCRPSAEQAYDVKMGQKLFQIVAFDGKPIRVEVVDELSSSERGEKGFGSTNNNS